MSDDSVEFAEAGPEWPYGRRRRRIAGGNEIRWEISPDGRRVGDIVAELTELRSDPEPAGPAGPLPGRRFFSSGIDDLFPDQVRVDWESWGVVEDALAVHVQRGYHVTLRTRAAPDAAGVELAIRLVDPQTNDTVDYAFGSLAEYAVPPRNHAAFARGVLGTAFGVLAPTAMPLDDGGVRLNDAGDVIGKETLDRITTRLTQWSAEQASGPRLLALAVAMVGDSAARSNGDSPSDGATEALNTLLDVPLLPEQNRVEAEAVLRAVLQTEEPASAGQRAPRLSEVVAAAEEITRDARVLHAGAGQAGPSQPAGRRPAAGRHRPQPGRHHRPAGGHHRRTESSRTVGIRVSGTGSLPGGRPRQALRLSVDEALNMLSQVRESDLGGSVSGQPVRAGRPGLAVVNTAAFGPQYFQVEIAQPGFGRAAATVVRSGRERDPHILRLPPHLAGDQLPRIWVHAISRTLQEVAAVRAGAGSGILARVRSRLSGETRDRRLAAQYDEFRLLSRNWQEARADANTFGLFDGGRRLSDLERDIQGLSAAITRQGHSPPVPPWTVGPIQVNAIPNRAGGATAGQVQGARPSALAHLRIRVENEVDALGNAVEYLRRCASYKKTTAKDAGEFATDMREEAEKERQLKDSGAAERARRMDVEAEAADKVHARHTSIAATHISAAKSAGEARETYRTLLAELDAAAADPSRPLDALHALADDAGRRVEAYKAGMQAALPPDTAVPSAKPVGRLPHVNALTRHINNELKARGVPARHRVEPEMLHWLLRAEFPRVVGQGLVRTVGDPADRADEVRQWRVRLRVPNLTEVFGAEPHSETVYTQLDQRAQTVTTTATRAVGITGKFGLRGLSSVVPGYGVLKLVAKAIDWFAPSVEAGRRRTEAQSRWSSASGRRGSAEDIRGEQEAMPFMCVDPVWEVEFRSSPFEPWSTVARVDASGPDDAHTLTLRMSHAYTVPASTATTDIVREGFADQILPRTSMPEHSATFVAGMNEIEDKAAVACRDMLGSFSAVAYGELHNVIKEWPGRLDEAVQAGGFARRIDDKKGPALWLQVESRIIWVKMLGEPSDSHWDEKVRVEIATSGASQTIGASTSKAVGQRVGFTAGRTTAADEGLTTAETKYEVGVERHKQTQGYVALVEHRLTGRAIGSDKSFTVTSRGTALLRMAEDDAFRYGWPVVPEAVERDEHDRPRKHPDGRILLRADPQPGRTDVPLPPLPAYMGRGERQLRGKGPGQVPAVFGLNETQQEVLKGLVREGLLPELDVNGQPKRDVLHKAHDKELLASQLDNWDRVRQWISALRAGTGYDQACQEGFTVLLERRRSGMVHAPERFVLELSLRQRFESAHVIGVSKSKTPVSLDISSTRSAESTNRTTTGRVDASLGVKGHVRAGSEFGATNGVISNRVTHREGGQPAVAALVPHTAEVSLRSAGGTRKRLASRDGAAVLLLEGEQCQPAPPSPVWSIRGQVGQRVLNRAQLLHMDAGDPRQQIWAALPPATRADPAAYHQLAAFLDVRSLIANPEWTRKAHRVRLLSPPPGNPLLAAQQAGLGPSEVTVELRARVVDLEHLSSGQPVSAKINLTWSSNGTSAGAERGWGAGVHGGVGAASVDWERDRGGSWSASQTEIGGWETLGVEVGVHDTFRARVVFDAVVTQKGKDPVTVPLEDGTALYSIPERHLLRMYGKRQVDLPVERTADAVERFLNNRLPLDRFLTDRLPLDRETATDVLRRYHEDKQGATDGLATEHTDERLATALRTVAGLREPVASEAARQDFGNVLDTMESLARQRTEVSVPEPYVTTVGDLRVDEVRLWADRSGAETDVLDDVKALIEQQTPGLLELDPTLADGLSNDLEGDRWLGHQQDIWSPRGWVNEYTVKVTENAPPERVRVRIVGRFDGPVTTDGTPDPPRLKVLEMVQRYLTRQRTQSRGRKVDYLGSVAASLGVPVAGGLATHRVHSLSNTNSHTLTWMQRISHDDVARVERDFCLDLQVERLPARGPATVKDRVRRVVGRQGPSRADSIEPVRSRLNGWMAVHMPRAYVGMSPPDPVLAQQLADYAVQPRPDHRRVTMPANPTFVSTQRPHLGHEQPADNLFEAMSTRMSGNDLLTKAGVENQKTRIETQLKPSRLMAAFPLLISDDGYRLEEFDVPGARRKVTAQIHARLYDAEVVADPAPELGEVARSEEITEATWVGNRLMPATRSYRLGAGTPVEVTRSVGEQVTDKVSDHSGDRGEHSMFIKPKRSVLVRLRYGADVTYRTRGLRLGSRPKVVDKEHIVAVGEAFVVMSENDYNAMRAQMESAPASRSAYEDRDVRHVIADELTDGPYRPLVEALAEARNDGVVVELTLSQGSNGPTRSYRANPDGTMVGDNDGGFAAAFATLHPQLALLAEGRVPLRDLYNPGRGQARFTLDVVAALRVQGVPEAVVDYAAHTVRPEQTTHHPPGEAGLDHPDGAAHTLGSYSSPGPSIGVG